jgi:Ca2+/H+ antiporter
LNEFQTSTHSSDFHQQNSADLVALGDGVKRAGPSKQARRRELLHEVAIIAVGVLVCVVAICIIVGRTHP